MFLRHRFMWLIIAVSIVLVVSACASEPTLAVTEGLTAEQITAVGCDPAASEGQIKRCFATVIGCDPKNLPDELKMNECMKAKIENDPGNEEVPGFDCGTIGETHPNEIAACMVGKIQSGEIPGTPE